MADLTMGAVAKAPIREASAWDRLKTNRDFLGAWFMLPAAGFLLLFLAYPLGLGIWMSFTDARIGRSGAFIGLENYEWLLDDTSFINATLFTIAYTVVASVFKFAIGLYLALILNKHIPFRAIVRAAILIPFIAITLLAGLQTVPPSLYEAPTLDGATPWQMFRRIPYPLLTPIIAVVM